MSDLRACLFSPEEEGCLLVRAGNRWKLWREREGAVELYHSDENETYTAACWACPQNLQGCLVLGCASGRVQAWDASSAELLGRPGQAFHALASGADCSVAALAASATRGTVFAACSGLPDILEIGLVDGVTRSSLASGKTSVSGLAVSGSAAEWLLSSSIGAPLKLWRLPAAGASLSNLHKASKCLKAPAGGAAHVDLCCFEGRLMALASDGAMQVDFFDAGPDNQGGVTHGKRTPTSSTRVLTCHERVKEARLAKERDAGGRLLVVGHGPSIVACWTFETGSDALVRTVAPTFSVSKTELGGTVLCARGAQLAMRSMRTERLMLVVAHGTAARPSFAQVTPPKTKKGAAVVEALAAAGQPRADDAANSVPAKQRAAAIVLGPAETAPQKRTKAEQQAVEDTGKRRKVAVPGSRPETAGSNLSLAPVLRQGLRSKDSSTLDKTLVLKDRDLMDTSVSELSSTEAYDLMQECAKRLMEKPMEGQVYCAWMQRVVYHHGTFIRSYPALRDALRPLHDATSSRCASYRTLMYMHGRLHGLVSRGNEVLEREATETVVRVPLLEYVEGDEDLEEEQKQEDDLGELDEDDDDDEDMDLNADDWLDSD